MGRCSGVEKITAGDAGDSSADTATVLAASAKPTGLQDPQVLGSNTVADNLCDTTVATNNNDNNNNEAAAVPVQRHMNITR